MEGTDRKCSTVSRVRFAASWVTALMKTLFGVLSIGQRLVRWYDVNVESVQQFRIDRW